ncbi:hypothetical protein B0H13DRAFT_2300092 [Mycena leptocephala]|nr:hypothetical protein B0H13DRAFT_2300092 [Mycena leptocephala]
MSPPQARTCIGLALRAAFSAVIIRRGRRVKSQQQYWWCVTAKETSTFLPSFYTQRRPGRIHRRAVHAIRAHPGASSCLSSPARDYPMRPSYAGRACRPSLLRTVTPDFVGLLCADNDTVSAATPPSLAWTFSPWYGKATVMRSSALKTRCRGVLAKRAVPGPACVGGAEQRGTRDQPISPSVNVHASSAAFQPPVSFCSWSMMSPVESTLAGNRLAVRFSLPFTGPTWLWAGWKCRACRATAAH